MFGKKLSIGMMALWYAMMSLIMFGFIFDFYFEAFGIPTFITSSRLSAILITILALSKLAIKRGEKKIFAGVPQKVLRQILFFHIPILIYMFILYVSIGVAGDDRHMFAVLIQMAVFRVIPIYAFFVCFDSLREFMIVVLLAIFLQTLIVWFCITNPFVKLTIDAMFNINDAYEEKAETYAGGLGCITSDGLIRYAVGEVACVYMYFKKNNFLYLFLLLIFSLTGALIARTGLVVSVFCFLFVLLYAIKKRGSRFYLSLFASLFIAILAYSVIMDSKVSRDFFEERFFRMNSLFEQSKSADNLYDISYFDLYMHDKETVIPPLSFETLIGTGVPSGKSGNGVYVNVDGGFFRLYVTYGLVLAIVFYLFFFSRLLKVSFSFKEIDIRYTLLLMFTLIIIGEFKEWSIYATCHVTIFFLMALLAYQDQKRVWA